MHILYFICLGVDFSIHTIDIDGKKIKLQVWDTSGRKQFNEIATDSCKVAMVSWGCGQVWSDL